jgi:uncharacterized protein YbjT (DUF2867 family)
MEVNPLVLITGITGYVGSHVTMEVLKTGKYRVRGSIRNKDDPKKIEFLKEIFQEDFEKIELVNVDLLDPQSLKEATKGTFEIFFYFGMEYHENQIE